MNNKFTGTGVALVTPFDKNLQIDWDGLKKLLQSTAEKGVDYYVVQGTTGESATTTIEEKIQILKFVQANNVKGLPIVYGLGGNNTKAVLDDLERVELDAVDAILSVSPYYNKPSQEGLYQHFKAIGDQSPVPVILYNVPGRTSSNISATTTLRLAMHSNIIGIKEASGILEQCMIISKSKPDDFLLISGDDMLTLPIISLGGAGVISVMANAFADIFREIVHSSLAGDYEKARTSAFKLVDINPLMYSESNPVGIKQVLKVMGVCENHVRMPLVAASDSLKAEINKCLPI